MSIIDCRGCRHLPKVDMIRILLTRPSCICFSTVAILLSEPHHRPLSLQVLVHLIAVGGPCFSGNRIYSHNILSSYPNMLLAPQNTRIIALKYVLCSMSCIGCSSRYSALCLFATGHRHNGKRHVDRCEASDGVFIGSLA